MAMLFSAARTLLDNLLPQTAPNYTTIRDEAIRQAVRYAAPRFTEETYQDFTATDAVTTRYALTGRAIQLLGPEDQVAPTGLNTAGVSPPNGAPQITASGAGSTFTAGLWYVGYEYTTALGRTEMSPLASITLTAGQHIVTGILTLPTNVTGVRWYLGTAVFNAVVQFASAVASGAAQNFAAPAVVGASPLINYSDFAALLPGALEPGVDVTGAANSLVTTLNLGAAPAAGAIFRVRMTRRPVVPVNPSDVIGLPDEWMSVVAPFEACQYLMLNHQAGDTARFAAVAASLEPLAMDLLSKATGRDAPPIRWTGWAV